MEIDRREVKVTVTLIGRERTKERFSYILEVTGSSRSRLAASYIGGSASRIVNRTSFPDTPPWRITFQISDGRNRLVHSEEVPDHLRVAFSTSESRPPAGSAAGLPQRRH